PVPEGREDHRLISVRPAIAVTTLDEPLDLAFGQVFACSDIGILGPPRRDFPYFGGWRYDSQSWFWHKKQSQIRKVSNRRCGDRTPAPGRRRLFYASTLGIRHASSCRQIWSRTFASGSLSSGCGLGPPAHGLGRRAAGQTDTSGGREA